MKTKKKKKAAAKKKSAPQKQRKTERIVLRLDAAVAARLRAIATRWHVTLGEVVTDALDALRTAR